MLEGGGEKAGLSPSMSKLLKKGKRRKYVETLAGRPGSALMQDIKFASLRTRAEKPLLMEEVGCPLARYSNPKNSGGSGRKKKQPRSYKAASSSMIGLGSLPPSPTGLLRHSPGFPSTSSMLSTTSSANDLSSRRVDSDMSRVLAAGEASRRLLADEHPPARARRGGAKRKKKAESWESIGSSTQALRDKAKGAKLGASKTAGPRLPSTLPPVSQPTTADKQKRRAARARRKAEKDARARKSSGQTAWNARIREAADTYRDR